MSDTHSDGIERDALLEFLREQRDLYEEIHKGGSDGLSGTHYTKGRYQSYADVIAWVASQCDIDTDIERGSQ